MHIIKVSCIYYNAGCYLVGWDIINTLEIQVILHTLPCEVCSCRGRGRGGGGGVVVPKEALIRKLEVPDVRVKEHRVLGHHSNGVSYRVLF